MLGAIGTFLVNQGIQVWPDEVPRYDTLGKPINPQATSSPSTWPATTLTMEGKSPVENTFEDSYSENPPIVVKVHGTTRQQVETGIINVTNLLAPASNWAHQNSPIGQIFANMGFAQFWLYDLQCQQWNSYQETDVRLAGDLLSWVAEMDLWVGLHGNQPSG